GAANNIQTAGTLVPDIVGSFRVDQAWGGAQIAAVAKDNRALYYNTNGLGILKNSDHPSDKWGFAVQGGIELNLPWAKGDSFAVQSQYCNGASEHCFNRGPSRFDDRAFALVNVNKVGLGWADNAYFASPAEGLANGGMQLPKIWNVYAAIQHYWVPEIRTSLYGGYVSYKANSSLVDSI